MIVSRLVLQTDLIRINLKWLPWVKKKKKKKEAPSASEVDSYVKALSY